MLVRLLVSVSAPKCVSTPPPEETGVSAPMTPTSRMRIQDPNETQTSHEPQTMQKLYEYEKHL